MEIISIYIFNIDKKSTYRKKSIWRNFFNDNTGNIGRLKYRGKNEIPTELRWALIPLGLLLIVFNNINNDNTDDDDDNNDNDNYDDGDDNAELFIAPKTAIGLSLYALKS